ncbi:MAG: DUF6600 domain-containing protein [Candidatus Kapaibacterium sp.]
MDNIRLRILMKSGLAALLLLLSAYLFASPAYSQIEPGQVTTVIDTVDDEEDLFDENTNYKEKYKDLNKDGEWVTITDTSLNDPDNPDERNVTNIRIINVWKPNGMNPDWTPYSYGRWVYTYTGWMWVTDYSWGWATYHYGRWVYDYYYGWVWLPGRYWAPSWVQWCYNSNYIGWYPIYPRRHRHHHHRYYAHGNPRHWVIVKRKDFTTKINKEVSVDSKENSKILEETKKIAVVKYDGKNITNVGPKVEVIEQNTGQKINPKKVSLSDKKDITKVDETTVSIYRNDVEKKTVTTGTKESNNINGTKKKDVKVKETSKNPDVKKETIRETAPKNKDENTNRNKQPNYEGSREKAPEQKVKTESQPPSNEGSRPPSNERSRQESSPKRDTGNSNRESNNSGRSNEGSRDNGNNNSKAPSRK